MSSNTNKTEKTTTIKIINFANPTSLSTRSNLRNSVLSTTGTNRNFNVAIACDTVILCGHAEDAYTVRVLEQVADAGGLSCMAFAI